MAPSITAVVALAGAGVVAVDPAASAVHENTTTRADVRLAADSSILNIPINLVQDVINIPYNEVQAINYLGDNLLFTGTWNVSSSTSVWGTDPGDIGRYSLVGLFIPFPAFSDAAAAQLAGLAEVLLPINSGCAGGNAGNGISCDDVPALIGGWFQLDRIVELLTTGQYTFDDTPVTEPDGTTHPPEGLWSFAGPVTFGGDFNHPEWNTKTDPATGEPVMPWAGTTFVLDPLSPVTNYTAHLMSDPTNAENAIKFPTIDEAAAAVQKFAEGLVVDLWPIFPGSPLCAGLCGPLSDLGEPFYHDPRYQIPPGAGTTTDSLTQNAAPLEVTSSSVPQSSGGDQNAAGRHSKVADELGIAQTTKAASTDNTGTSTDALDHQTKPAVTKDGKKFEPRRPNSDAGRPGGLARAVNAGLDQLRSSLSPKKPSGAASDDPEAGESRLSRSSH